MDGELWRIWQVLLVIGITTSFQNAKADSDPNEFRPIAPIFDDSKHIPGEPMTPIDFQNAKGTVADHPPKTDANGRPSDPIEFAGLYEGDIILKDRRNSSEGTQRNAIINPNLKWPQGQVPYVISSEFSAQQRGVIAKAMLEYQQRTCVSFKPRTTENDYIHIHRGSGCSSYVGRSGGVQPVSIGPGCEYTGIVIHELMHAVGFWHEQSRPDRDDFVTVYYQNIQSGMAFNFQKMTWRETQNLSCPYDLTSVMHYGSTAFSMNGRPTILPKDPNKQIGQRGGFSTIDLEKVNRLYKCGTPVPGPGPKPTTTPPTPTTKPPTSCGDLHRHCSYWSQQGECTKNPSWMKANCRSSCNECNKPCEDLNKYCATWAKREECTRNPDYMLTYCQRSCNSCPNPGAIVPTTTTSAPGPSSCQDSDKYCNYWASNGECNKNPRYMHKNCPRACNVCRP